MGEHDNSGDYGPPRKRRRPAKSCDQCRNRKVRCDLNHPCGPCQRARSELPCSYREGLRDAHNSPTANGVTVPRNTLNEVCTPDDRLEHFPPVPRVRDIPQEQEASLVVGRSSGTTLSTLQDRLSNLEEQLPSLRQTVANEQQHTLQDLVHRLERAEQRITLLDAGSQHKSSHSDPHDLAVPPIAPRLRAVPQKTKLYGPTHWLHTAEQIHVIGKFSDREAEPDFGGIRSNLRDSFKECRNLRHAIKRQQQPLIPEAAIQDLVSTIPSKAICDTMLSGYLSTFEPLYRVLLIPLFKNEYDEFWLHPTDTKRPFLIKLLLVLAIGSTFYNGQADFQHLRTTAQAWIYSAQAWLTGPTEKSTLNLDGLQAFCLLLLARRTNSLSASPSLSTGSLLTMAMSIGLHRDPDIFAVLSTSQKEMRRRLWTTVLELVLQHSIDTGTPLLLSPGDFDTKPPSEFDDDKLSQSEDSSGAHHPAERFTDTSIQITLQQSLPLRFKAVQILNGFGNNISYGESLRLGAELQTACRDAASFFQQFIASQNERKLRPTVFHQKYVDVTLRRNILLLHKPFMIQAAIEPRFYMSRKMCLESCMVITSYIDNLDLTSGVLDDFSKLTIRSAGSFRGPMSLDIISALCLELTTQLSEDGPRTKPDALGALRKAGRKPILDKLEHIKDQSLQIIALGNPSMKRYNFLAAILGQIRALEAGQPVDEAVYDAVNQSLKDSYNALQATQIGITPYDSIDTLENATTTISSESFDFDLGPWNPDQFLDPLNLLYVPGFSNEAQSGSDLV